MTRPQPNRKSTLVRTGLCAAALSGTLMLATPPAAYGQAADRTSTGSLRPPRPEQPAKPPVITNFLIAGVVLVSIVAATVIPAKRGHQD